MEGMCLLASLFPLLISVFNLLCFSPCIGSVCNSSQAPFIGWGYNSILLTDTTLLGIQHLILTLPVLHRVTLRQAAPMNCSSPFADRNIKKKWSGHVRLFSTLKSNGLY